MSEPKALAERKQHIVLGVCGSIAAYKAAELARRLVAANYEVRCVMTEAAQEFLGAKTLEAITGAAVITGFWDGSENGSISHIALADWADCVVIAPATADTIAKLALGFSENPLLALVLATRAATVVAPAMNCNMWEHAATQRNVETLRSHGVTIVDPAHGMLACGWEGSGRLAELDDIVLAMETRLSVAPMQGMRVLVAAGPTREPIDPVRFISNRSSGKMGIALVRQALIRGAAVELVHGPIDLAVPRAAAVTPVTTAQEMYDVVRQRAHQGGPWDMIIMAAAVADFRPRHQESSKIKGSRGLESLSLEANPDILATLGTELRGRDRPYLIGFAVATGAESELVQDAKEKLARKRADMVVANLAADGFEGDTNRVWLVDSTAQVRALECATKDSIAGQILEAAIAAKSREGRDDV